MNQILNKWHLKSQWNIYLYNYERISVWKMWNQIWISQLRWFAIIVDKNWWIWLQEFVEWSIKLIHKTYAVPIECPINICYLNQNDFLHNEITLSHPQLNHFHLANHLNRHILKITACFRYLLKFSYRVTLNCLFLYLTTKIVVIRNSR